VYYFGAVAGRGAANPFENDRGGRSGVRAQLEAIQPAVVMQDDEIGERAACVNADSQGRIPLREFAKQGSVETSLDAADTSVRATRLYSVANIFASYR
jgi:hypothetical protein